MRVDPARIEIIEHRSPFGEWQLLRCAPHARLSALVCSYEGYRERAGPTVRRVEAALPAVVVMFNFGPHWRLGDGRSPGRLERFGSFVAGMYSTYAVSENTGPSYCLQMNLTPLGARMLFGMPMRHLAERVHDLRDVLGSEARRLEEQLAEAPDWEARFALADAFVRRRAAEAAPVHPALRHAWQRMCFRSGDISVAVLAQEVDWSRKHLAIRFHDEIGLSPKTAGRILRFRRAVDGLSAAARGRWSEIALDCGYFDQAHLIRDFRHFAGMSPTEYQRRRLPDGTGVIDDLGLQ